MTKFILYSSLFSVMLSIILIDKIRAQDTLTSRQITAIIKEKNARTKIQQKIDSRLLQAIKEKRENKNANNMGAGVNADKDGNVKVDINAEVTESLLKKIKASGGTIVYASKEYHSILAEINLSVIEKIASCSEVAFIKPASVPRLNRIVTTPANPLRTTGTDSPAAKTPK